MNVDQYFRWLEKRLEEQATGAFEEETKYAARFVVERIPANRTRTKKAVRYQVDKSGSRLRGRIGLKFSNRYRSRNTETERIFNRIRKQLRPRFVAGLNRKLKSKMGEI